MTGIPSWARVGAKVVCVIAPVLRPTCEYDRKCKVPVVGETYTIRATKIIGGEAGVWLEEMVNPTGDPRRGLNGETGFYLLCFRPLVTLESDITEHFAQYLKTDHRAPEKADA